MAIDTYPDRTNLLTKDWISLLKKFDGKKLLAIAEFKTMPDVDKMQSVGVYWDYIVSWSGELGAKGLDKETLNRVYHLPQVVNKQDLPKELFNK